MCRDDVFTFYKTFWKFKYQSDDMLNVDNTDHLGCLELVYNMQDESCLMALWGQENKTLTVLLSCYYFNELL